MLLSTHIVSDIEYIANEILLMRNGKIAISGTADALIQSMGDEVWSLNVPKAMVESYLKKYKVSPGIDDFTFDAVPAYCVQYIITMQ